MIKLYAMSILAGVLFAIWPRYMNQSGLSGNTSSALFALGCLLIIVPFALKSGGSSIATANWKYLVIACVLGATGMLAFNGMLAQATPKQMGPMFLALLMTQVVTSAIFQVYQTGTISLKQIVGFASAALTVIVLV